MNTVSEVMTALEKKGSAQTRKIFGRHGAPENMFGVKVADLKVIAKKIKGQQELAYELYETENSDAMYLAGLVADGSLMNKRLLDTWARKANWYMISEYTVPWVASESPHGRDMAMKWIKQKKESIAASGWSTYGALVSVLEDSELDLKEIKELISQCGKTVHDKPNRVRYSMNGFVIAVGSYVEPLLKQAVAAAKKMGTVSVEMGETACKVPLATEYIAKIEKMGRVGKKKKTAKC